MRNTLLVLITLVLLMGISGNVSAQNSKLNTQINEYNVDNGENVEVPINVSGESIAGYSVTLEYNENMLEVESVNSADFEQIQTKNDSGTLILKSARADLIKDPTIAKVEFKSVNVGTSDIKLNKTETQFNNINIEDINTDYNQGEVDISPRTAETAELDDIEVKPINTSDITFGSEIAVSGILTSDVDLSNKKFIISYDDSYLDIINAKKTQDGKAVLSPQGTSDQVEFRFNTKYNINREIAEKTTVDIEQYKIEEEPDNRIDDRLQPNDGIFTIKPHQKDSVNIKDSAEIKNVEIENPNGSVINFNDKIRVKSELEHNTNLTGKKFLLVYNNTNLFLETTAEQEGDIGNKYYSIVSKNKITDRVNFTFDIKNSSKRTKVKNMRIDISQFDSTISNDNKIPDKLKDEDTKFTVRPSNNETNQEDNQDEDLDESDNETEDNTNETEDNQDEDLDESDNETEDNTNETNNNESDNSIIDQIVSIVTGILP